MNPLTPRALKIISVQRWILLFSLLAAPAAVYFGLEWAGLKGAIHWLLTAVISYFAVHGLFQLILYFAVMRIYNGDMSEIAREAREMKWVDNEAEEVPREDTMEMLCVAKSEKVIGRYLDADIWEWIEFEMNGQRVIATFADTINPKQMNTFPVPEEHALFPPGILYKLSPKQVEEANI